MTTRYSDHEVRLILKEAAELQEREAGAAGARDGLTLAELEQVASDVGLDPALVRRAAAKVDAKAHAAPAFAGAPMRVILERALAGELPEAAHERVVDAVRLATGELGTVSIIGRTLTWGAKSPGVTRQVTVVSRDGRTTVRVEGNLGELAGVVQGVGGAASIVAALIAGGSAFEVASSVPVAIAAALAGVGGVWLLGRLGFRAGERSERKEIEALLERVSAAVGEAMGDR